jgi:hypothetical protein
MGYVVYIKERKKAQQRKANKNRILDRVFELLIS